MSDDGDDASTGQDSLEHHVTVLDLNRVSFSGPVTSQSVTRLLGTMISCAKGLAFERDDRPPVLYLHIDSGGGCLHTGFRAYDNLRRLAKRVELVTIAEGRVFSAATLLFLAGTRRLATPNSWFLFHQLSTGVHGKHAEIQDEAANCKFLMKQMVRLYVKESSMTRSEVKKMVGKEVMVSARQAKRQGFVHEMYS